ncbi:hypothetical protein GUITHDRAFT_152547 [Guillardia theta CCMP2712]|uniref:Uncharacterized protein n=2 Tax=Guillardia theta TaxID=55529 RepID=L1JCW6_GUITC|nr:hypothetical protein GUITHDRAFT_152547 [Guillardia theta CCMP2712]EKX46157.1 hypothetical protein GUITHDRAFT_152547 [Guillardia theta CCMP2712]|mmetsp:Transcript_31059/g.99656  ORF Transcript_31059/g.99656 Transcript_31059/m.99656 type:complete len:345 (+) Transcript_31059:134-1168(+)|eukprot:XP_005833137.1 hypothetical protein GUITHDRAFT_152547 [Guillardia theta CCMP2712]
MLCPPPGRGIGMVPGLPWCPGSRQRLLDMSILVLSLLLFASSLGHVPQHDLQWRQVAQELHENNNALLSALSPLNPAPPAPPQLEHVDVCLQGSCSNQAMHGHPGTSIKLYCQEHKQALHRVIHDLPFSSGVQHSRHRRIRSSFPQRSDRRGSTPRQWLHKKCREEGCSKQPCFGLVGSPPVYCNLHRTKDMQNVASRKCRMENCTKQASYGESGGQIKFCMQHKNESHVNLRTQSSTRKHGRQACLLDGLNDEEMDLLMKKNVSEMNEHELRGAVLKFRTILRSTTRTESTILLNSSHQIEPWAPVSSTSMHLARLLEMDYDATTFDAVLQDQFDTLDKLRGF